MPSTFSFSVPSLPKPWYEFLTRLRRQYEMSPWQVVILALMALHELGSQAEGRPVVERMIQEVRQEFPARYVEPKGRA